MREMKDSGVQWIGEMPSDWMTMRVKNVASKMQSGGTPDSSNDGFYVEKENGIPWVTIADMSTVSYVTDTGKYISEEAQKSKNLIIFSLAQYYTQCMHLSGRLLNYLFRQLSTKRSWQSN